MINPSSGLVVSGSSAGREILVRVGAAVPYIIKAVSKFKEGFLVDAGAPLSSGQTTPVDVVFAAAIHADDGEVVMVVRQGPLAAAPYNVEDGQVGATHQNVSEGSRLFA